MLHQILPPRLEDAGLEDPALPPDSIYEAFLKAAAAVKSRAASIFSSTDDEDDAGCVDDPWLTAKDASDAVIVKGFEAAADQVKVVGDGGGSVDDLVMEVEAKLGEDVEACVDELQGLDIKDEKKDGEESDEENKKPTLVEGYV